MRTEFLFKAICLFVFVTNAYAESPKKGRVMCEGVSCESSEIPTGSILEKTGEFAVDLVSRAKRRIEIANEPQPSVREIKKTVNKKDRIRNAQGAPERTNVEMSSTKTLGTNLPRYYEGIDRSEIEASEKVVFVPKSSEPRLKGMKPGDVVWAIVEQEIVASPSVPTPVRAIAISGNFKGAAFLGEAVLDHELKRVLFNFTKLRIKDRESVFTLKAAGLSPRGSVGLEGEYVSQAGKFFVAELASAAATGFMDSTVNRSQTSLGTYVQEPSISNSGKIAAVTALSKTTERLAEAARNAPEFTKTAGYQEIQVIIQDEPVETGALN